MWFRNIDYRPGDTITRSVRPDEMRVIFASEDDQGTRRLVPSDTKIEIREIMADEDVSTTQGAL